MGALNNTHEHFLVYEGIQLELILTDKRSLRLREEWLYICGDRSLIRNFWQVKINYGSHWVNFVFIKVYRSVDEWRE